VHAFDKAATRGCEVACGKAHCLARWRFGRYAPTWVTSALSRDSRNTGTSTERWLSGEVSPLLQLRVFGLGLFIDRNVGIGILPEGKEIFIRRECLGVGGIGIRALRVLRLQCIRTSHAKMR